MRRVLRNAFLLMIAAVVAIITLFAAVNPPTTAYMIAEARRLGGIDRQWIPITEVAPVFARSVVAAEDANFCLHWGFDMEQIRTAIDGGSLRGASTITQQMVKNLFLWQGRSWTRKALEAFLTPIVEIIWTKQRILEVYLNIVEFDEGVFGIDAAAHAYFRTEPARLTAAQAARIAVVLPNPKGRDAANLSAKNLRWAEQVADGAATIDRDGRAACFEVENR